jgi:DNA sulfur modification protein DndD
MFITKIKVRNFKTYLNLDLDVSVEAERPIVLIGGKNGGGKTTLFEAIYGALYGLKINNPKQFGELLNAGAIGSEDQKIMLELHFTGKVLSEDQQYILTRTYALNSSQQPVESVRLNMNGTVFMYGSSTPPAQRAEQQAQVSKIIKANLPQELSRYFLFDAMEAGNLLKEDQLNKVIKENIENVMGFNKYIQLAKSAEVLFRQYSIQRLDVENEKKTYLALVEQKKQQETLKTQLKDQWQAALEYSMSNQQFYSDLKAGLSQETTLKNKIEQTILQIEVIHKKEGIYRTEIDNFVKDIELNICLPKLSEAFKSEIGLVLKFKNEQQQLSKINLSPSQIEAVGYMILQYLKQHNLVLQEVPLAELVDYVLTTAKDTLHNDPYHFLDYQEINALEGLLANKSNNAFLMLSQQQVELNLALGQVTGFEAQIDNMKAQTTGRDYNLLKAYEDNEAHIKTLQNQIVASETEIAKIDKKIHQFDGQMSQEPDPKYEALGKLKAFFEDIANQLLKVKKQQIELKMKQDLNTNLAAYQDVVARVELSENLTNLTFKIYHKAGNEIYLNQLNTASKQVVVQVLLKALHEYGDYDPPVMIDTVMGVLDETSRTTVLENYFPVLSHQTILLSSDSEIRVGSDFKKLEPFISKVYTLERDREKQSTDAIVGYFGKSIN